MSTSADRRSMYQRLSSELGQSFERAKKWKPRDGRNHIRIIPAFDPEMTNQKEFFKKFLMAHDLGANGNRVVVPNMADPNDPFRKYYDALCLKTDDASKAEAERIRPKECYVIFVIDRESNDPQPLAWWTTANNCREISALCAEPMIGDITLALPDEDNKGAHDLIVTRDPPSATHRFHQYKFMADPSSTPLGSPEQIEAWTSEDLFETFGIGKPSDPEWIQACLENRDQEFIDAQQQQGSQPATDLPAPAAAPPMPPTGEPTVELPPGVTDATGWWVAVDGRAQDTSTSDIVAMVKAGNDPTLCRKDAAAEGWKAASVHGFKLVQTNPLPPPMPGPESAPPLGPPPLPTAPGGTVDQLEEMMRQAQQETSADAQAIEQSLKQ